jgi:hypothetical protein
MAMMKSSYDEIANRTIRKFIKAVVLIDDHWSETRDVPISGDFDPTQLNLDTQPIPSQEDVDLANTTQNEGNSTTSESFADPDYLRDIGKEITDQGFLFTGFAYTDAQSETALNLASKSDILILDWYLGSADSRPALDLLEELKEAGSPRFIFILTDHDLAEVRRQLNERFGEMTEGTDTIFSCGSFSFSIKNKSQIGGSNSVSANQVIEEAITGIRERFGGLLQLAALELLGQYRDCLHEVLEHFHEDTDLPFILEWLEKESPIRDSHSFNALAIDEWTAMVTRRFPASTAPIIKDETVSALLADWDERMALPEEWGEELKELIKEEKIPFPNDSKKTTELMESLREWMTSSDSCWPTILEGSNKNSSWGEKARRILAMSYLGLRKGVTSLIETLIDFDVLFQCKASLPLELGQGTILENHDGSYLICITTTCDCNRPTRVKNCFVFLEAQKIPPSMLGNHSEGVVVAARTEENKNLLLAVALKPTFTYKIANPSLKEGLKASFPFGSEDSFDLRPIAQLRPARVQSLISLAAGKAIEVGLDRSELLRQLCKLN